MSRTNQLLPILLAAMLTAGATAAQAQAKYPDRPVKVVVPFPAASASDNIGRVVLQELGTVMDGTFVIDNKAGASGLIGVEFASRAAPDGYTLVVGSSSTHSINPWLFKKLPYEPVTGMTNIACLAVLPQVVVVSADSPFKTLRDLVDFGKSSPASLTYAYGTSSAQVAGAAFAGIAGVKVQPVPYKGPSEGLLAVMRGETHFIIADLTSSMGQIRGGKLRALAIASQAGSPHLPNVPSFDAAGFPGYRMVTWVGLSGPANMPRNVSNSIAQATEAAVRTEAVKTRFQDWGIETCAQGQPAFEKFVVEQHRIWGTKVQDLGITPQ